MPGRERERGCRVFRAKKGSLRGFFVGFASHSTAIGLLGAFDGFEGRVALSRHKTPLYA